MRSNRTNSPAIPELAEGLPDPSRVDGDAPASPVTDAHGEDAVDEDWSLDPDPQVVHQMKTLHVEGPWAIERTWLCTSAKQVASVFGDVR